MNITKDTECCENCENNQKCNHKHHGGYSCHEFQKLTASRCNDCIERNICAHRIKEKTYCTFFVKDTETERHNRAILLTEYQKQQIEIFTANLREQNELDYSLQLAYKKIKRLEQEIMELKEANEQM